MRVLALVACGFLLADMNSAVAADCTRGMLWPYVRNPGDCLTDTEIQAGQKGVYNGPLNTNPDLSAIRPEDMPPPAQAGSCGGSWLLPFGKDCPPPAVISESASQGAAAANAGAPGGVPPVNAATAAPSAAANVGTVRVSCGKGWLWPFVREAGECPTDIEKKQGRTRAVTTASNQQPAPAGTQAVASPGQIPAATPTNVSVPEAPPAETCHKGWLWPFKREPGDCPTSQEKARERQEQQSRR